MATLINLLTILSLLYFVFYLFYSQIKLINSFFDKLIFCSVCASFFTVLVIVTAFSLIFKIPLTLSAFLMGMSATGISYTLEKHFEKKKIPMGLFLFQLLVTIIGITILYILGGLKNGI